MAELQGAMRHVADAIAMMKELSGGLGERDELTEELARLKAAVADATDNLDDLKREFADLDRRRAQRIVQHQYEDSRLISSLAEGRKELNRLDKELGVRRKELADVNAAIDRVRQKLNGA